MSLKKYWYAAAGTCCYYYTYIKATCFYNALWIAAVHDKKTEYVTNNLRNYLKWCIGYVMIKEIMWLWRFVWYDLELLVW
jgi:hypothetical protein